MTTAITPFNGSIFLVQEQGTFRISSRRETPHTFVIVANPSRKKAKDNRKEQSTTIANIIAWSYKRFMPTLSPVRM